MNRPKIFGHRGASDDAPENTILAFQLAMDQGADGIETDLRFTADGVIICHHDADLERSMGKRTRVSELAYDELRGLSVFADFFRGESVPTLDDLLAWRPSTCCLMLELKDDQFHQAEKMELLKQHLDQSGVFNQLWITSFDEVSLKTAHAVMPEIPLIWISKNKIPLEDLWMVGYSPHYTVLEEDPDLCKVYQTRGKSISVWDPHPEERVDMYRRQPVDTVTPNSPERFLRAWEKG